MVRFLRRGKSCAVAASALLFAAAGCGTAGDHGPSASRPRTAQSRTAQSRTAQSRTSQSRTAQHRSARAHPSPSAAGPVKRADFLTGISCLPVGTCVAVGWYYYGTVGPTLTLAVRWTGRAWLRERAPSRGRDSSLGSVSCAVASWCLAAGTPFEAWTGTRWSIIPGSTVSLSRAARRQES